MFFDTDEIYRGSDGKYKKFSNKNKPHLPRLNHTYVYKNHEEVDIAIANFIEALICAYDYLDFKHLKAYHRSTEHNHYASLIIYDEHGAMVFILIGNYEHDTVICDVEIY